MVILYNEVTHTNLRGCARSTSFILRRLGYVPRSAWGWRSTEGCNSICSARKVSYSGSCIELIPTTFSHSVPATLLLKLDHAKEESYGNAETRDASYVGSLPVEQHDNGDPINPVRSSERCYPLGVTYERQNFLAGPNANCKKSDASNHKQEIRKELLQV